MKLKNICNSATPDVVSCPSQEEMTSALATMRVDYDQVKIKDLDTSSNPLLNKRRKKAAAGAKGGSTVCQSQWQIPTASDDEEQLRRGRKSGRRLFVWESCDWLDVGAFSQK